MFTLWKPTSAGIDAFLEKRKDDTYSYPEVGGTRNPPFPNDYVLDHNRQLVGHGEDDFERAKAAVRNWAMFSVPGVELFHGDTPIEAGREVAIVARHLGFYSLNSCRIVYVIDWPRRFGFAYGTLSEHVEIGEERFLVDFHRDTGEVWYDLLAFSRPAHPFVKLGYAYGRYRQRRFARGSKESMRRAVQTI